MSQHIKNQIKSLERSMIGDMEHDMKIRDKIHNLKMELNGTKPSGSEIDCINCGS